jgi:hypothetical protein
MKDISKEIAWLVKNWKKVPHLYKTTILDGKDSQVILLLDRQKPSVMRDYSFDEERIGVHEDGKVTWGFDSGCSCPSPWHDNAPHCYNCTDTWKEFALDTKSFDPDWAEVCLEVIQDIKKACSANTKKSTV